MTTIVPLYLFKGDSLKKRLLFYFFGHPRSELYLREIAVLLALDPANLSRELQDLEGEGIFRSRTSGNRKYFSLNRDYSLYDEMRSIVEKTAPQERSSQKRTSSVYVIAGPNGAGKTTFAKTFFPRYLNCKVFINADLIAGGLAPLAPERAALKAGKLLLEEIKQTARRGIDFGFETTLSGKSYVRLFGDLIRSGYAIHLFFLWIPNVEISLRRIRERVRRGGHNIPEPVVRRRFHRGIENLFKLYAGFLSSWTIFDNSTPHPEIIAYQAGEKQVVILEPSFAKIKKLAGVT
ncbi:MAG: hypothetical protein HY588_01875 [Candidatus Omnitrophica bacterium]|nr:hypothetical protein [Candidatus Omnitrophota bacterium]